MFSSAQIERLEACARVLDPPARVVMTGNVAPDAVAAIRRGANRGVDVFVVGTGEIASLEGSIDVLFIGPAAPYSVAAELFARWPGRVAPGGLLFVHGAFAAPPLTVALLRAIGASRAWRYYGREGALAEYVRADLTHGERVLDAIAQLAQLAYFTRRMARRRCKRETRRDPIAAA
ncbi:MAG: hypothetical protein QOH83_1458 [Solirubrobacteraceae bacterium]|nr:hypothetical protein [Solirubrobacteraceae bacterium]